LFKPYPDGGAPGEVLYDPTGRAPIGVLEATATAIFKLKGETFDQPEYAYFSKYLLDEQIRVFGLDVPPDIVPYPLKVSSVYFDRQHLPGGLLAKRALPFLISDAYPGVLMPLHKSFWPEKLRSQWAPNDATDLSVEEPVHTLDITVSPSELEGVRRLLRGDASQGDTGQSPRPIDSNAPQTEQLFLKGLAHANGEGMPQNFSRARHYWSLAADLGHAPSMHNLGAFFANGSGGKADFKTAVKYFRLAAENGLAQAQLELGRQHLRKDSGIYSRKEAMKWLTHAVEQNNAEAKNLIEMHGLQEEEPSSGLLSRLFGRK
jgi:Sel1 repeat